MDFRRHCRLSLQACLWSGLASAVVMALASRSRGDRAPTAVNGPSHWLFGEPAVHDQRLNVRHTVVGLLVHQASSLLWSSFFAAGRLSLSARGHNSWRCIATEAATLGAMAALVDLVVVPQRLSPGFERRLAAKQLTAVYGSFAAGLAIAAWRDASRRSHATNIVCR